MVSEIVRYPSAGPVDITLRDYHADRAVGNLSSIGNIVNTAAEMICGLYGKSPSSFLRIVDPSSGLIDNNRPIFDDLCAPIAPLPPPPQQQFGGGQCEDVRYNVSFTATLRGEAVNGVYPSPRNVSYTAALWGKVGSFTLAGYEERQSGPFTYRGYSRIECICKGDGGLPNSGYGPATILGSSGNEIQSFSIGSVSRVDGQADSCGSRQPSYPPTSPDPNDYTRIFPIPQPDGSTKNTSVTIIPTFAPIIGIFRPEINVDVGGINVNFSLGGFTLSPTIEIPVGADLPIGQPSTTTNKKVAINIPISGGGGTTDLKPALDAIADLKKEVEECCDRYHPFSDLLTSDYDIATLGSGSSGSFNLPAKAYRVVLQITNPDSPGRSQAGINAPNVLYAGWAWFFSGGGMATRHPIDSPIKSFEVPARSDDKFAYTLNGSYNANVVCYFSKK